MFLVFALRVIGLIPLSNGNMNVALREAILALQGKGNGRKRPGDCVGVAGQKDAPRRDETQLRESRGSVEGVDGCQQQQESTTVPACTALELIYTVE